MQKQLLQLMPFSLQMTLKKIYYFPIEIIEGFRDRESMIPPKSMNFVGSGDFEQTGHEFKDYFIDLVNLNSNDRVLDVGCGIGRMAIPLTSYLSKNGEYWGFDIVKMGIEWCQNRISSKFSNFHFLHSDVYNKYYNPRGKTIAKDFRFPFEDNFFDFIFLTSVFTHMLPLDLENYLSEISRVLKTGGKSLITFFLINEESNKLIQAGSSNFNFRYELDGCFTNSEKDPEAAVAYDEEVVRELFEKNEFHVSEPIRYGDWCGRDTFLSHQDIIIALKIR